jgi:transposase InsO family protein
MSIQSLAKERDEYLVDFIEDYRRKHPGELQMEEVAAWAIAEDLWEPRPQNPVRQLARELRRVARKMRVEDPQGRKVRAMHAAKHQRVDANGNKVFDVVWDYLFTMSDDHALKSFTQRGENIRKQCDALNRDIESFNDNNPNAEGREIQLKFAFMVEKPVDQAVHAIEESAIPKKPR